MGNSGGDVGQVDRDLFRGRGEQPRHPPVIQIMEAIFYQE